MAATIAKLFFPTGCELTSVLLSVGTFGAAAVVRPAAGIALGIHADRVGRKASLSLTIFVMALGTGLMALAPTYASIGIAAPLLIVIARLLQGFVCGGELGGATAILVENAPDRWRASTGAGKRRAKLRGGSQSRCSATIVKRIKEFGLRLSARPTCEIIDPNDREVYKSAAALYGAKQKRDGVSQALALSQMRNNGTLLAAMLLEQGIDDAMLCGVIGPTSDHLLAVHDVIGVREFGLSATARSAISMSLSQSPTMYAEVKPAHANVSGSLSSTLNAKRSSRTASLRSN